MHPTPGKALLFGVLSSLAALFFIGAGTPLPTTHQDPREIHCKHFIYGMPLGTPVTNDLIIRDIYALSSNDANKFADWVAYRLDPETVI